MAITLVAHTAWAPGGSGGASGGIDTTGATLLVIHAASFAAVSSVSDSKGNTWTALTQQNSGGVRYSRLWYAANPTVGSGHTFTVSGTSIFPYAAAAAFSGADVSAPFDQQNGASGTGVATLAAGSVTPAADGEVVVTGVCGAVASVPTVDGGFSVTDAAAFASGTAMQGGLAYKVQTTAAAVNPTWSLGGADDVAATIATFKAGADGGQPALRRLGGVGGGRPVEIGHEGVRVYRAFPADLKRWGRENAVLLRALKA